MLQDPEVNNRVDNKLDQPCRHAQCTFQLPENRDHPREKKREKSNKKKAATFKSNKNSS